MILLFLTSSGGLAFILTIEGKVRRSVKYSVTIPWEVFLCDIKRKTVERIRKEVRSDNKVIILLYKNHRNPRVHALFMAQVTLLSRNEEVGEQENLNFIPFQ